jgi:hypothetical protein
MARDGLIQGIAGCVLAACLGASSLLTVRLSALAGRAEMVYTDRAEDNESAEVALGIAMGAFRGVFVNLLWMRANDMKEAGKFYEAVELSKAITRLQPRFPRVWVFHAWNLAYNISVMTKTREERWNWVNQGIQLLRDQAIPANPNDLLLHKELAWIYLHKIQGTTDDANQFYKRMVAMEWTFTMGPPPKRGPEDMDRERAIEKYASWLSGFQNAAGTFEEVALRSPAAISLLEALRTQVGLNIETPSARDELLARYEGTRGNLNSVRREPFLKAVGPRTKAMATLIEDPQYAKAWDELLRHVRRRVLVEDRRMELDRMIRYTRKYGPMDWRHPASHALYWSARGVEEAQDRVRAARVDETGKVIDEGNRKDFDFLNTDRVVAQSVQELFRSGDLYFDFVGMVNGAPPMHQGTPSVHFADSYGQILDELRKRAGFIDAQRGNRWVSPLSDGYQNFMIDVCLYFYRRNDMTSANKWLVKLRTFEDMNTYDPNRGERFRDLDEFAIAEMKTRASSGYVAQGQITGSLIGAYVSGLLDRDPEMFERQFKYAKDFHEYYFKQQGRANAVNIEQQRTEVVDPDFEFLAGFMFQSWLEGLGVDEAVYVYAGAPRDLQQWGYDAMFELHKKILDGDAERSGSKKFDQLFPEPPGMQDFRTRINQKIEQRRRVAPNLESN